MRCRDRNSAPCVLVIGYGNTLRGDDAVGQRVALTVAGWQMPGLNVLAVHQLTPDLAAPVSRYDLAIFVDAKVASLAAAAVTVHHLEPFHRLVFNAHTSDPRGVLTLAQAIYGRHAPAWLVSVPAVDFSPREELSTVAARGAIEASSAIAALIEDHAKPRHEPRSAEANLRCGSVSGIYRVDSRRS